MLETDRLILRPMQDSDAIHLFELNADPEVVRYTGDSPCKNLGDAQRIISDLCVPQFHRYQMGRFSTLLKDGTYLGWCGLKFFPDNGEVDLGYRFHRRHWGKGYATEASQACLQYGFEKLNLKKIVARAMPDNLASIKVLQKLGMSYRGIFNDPTFPHGFVLFEQTKDEYRPCKD